MNKEFIPYEQALELKELGFDEPCLALYKSGNQFMFETNDSSGLVSYFSSRTPIKPGCESCLAPTFSQAFRWFREKHDLHSYIEMYRDDNSHYFDYVTVNDIIGSVDYGDGLFNTYEEAELACLNKLIEIVKNK
jgi:hypothetical protein